MFVGVIIFLRSSGIDKITIDNEVEIGSATPQSTEDWWSMFRHDPAHTGYSIPEAPGLIIKLHNKYPFCTTTFL